MIPKIYVVERTGAAAWGNHNHFTLTFEEAEKFVHDLKDAMQDQRYLEYRTDLQFFILIIIEPSKGPAHTMPITSEASGQDKPDHQE
jgi:hypothetical protein